MVRFETLGSYNEASLQNYRLILLYSVHPVFFFLGGGGGGGGAEAEKAKGARRQRGSGRHGDPVKKKQKTPDPPLQIVHDHSSVQ